MVLGLNFSSSEMRELYERMVKNTTNILNSTISQIDSSIAAENTIEVIIEGTSVCLGGRDFKQDAQITSSKIGMLNVTQKNDIANQVIDDISKDITQTLEQVNKDLVPADFNIAKTVTDIVNSMKTELETNIKTVLSNKISSVIGSKNTYKYIVGKGGLEVSFGKCTLTQSTVINDVSQSITDEALSTVLNNTEMVKLLEKFKVDISQKNLGINLTMIFAAIAGIAAVILLMMFGGKGSSMKIIIFIVVLVIVLLGGYYFYKGGK